MDVEEADCAFHFTTIDAWNFTKIIYPSKVRIQNTGKGFKEHNALFYNCYIATHLLLKMQ